MISKYRSPIFGLAVLAVGSISEPTQAQEGMHQLGDSALDAVTAGQPDLSAYWRNVSLDISDFTALTVQTQFTTLAVDQSVVTPTVFVPQLLARASGTVIARNQGFGGSMMAFSGTFGVELD